VENAAVIMVSGSAMALMDQPMSSPVNAFGCTLAMPRDLARDFN